MRRLNKTLVLCVIMVLVIIATFTLSACDKRKIESVTVEIIGGGEKVVLTEQEASADAIRGKIKVIAQRKNGTTQELTTYLVEGFNPTKFDVVQTVTIRYEEFTSTVAVEVRKAPQAQIVSIAVSFTGERIVLQEANATEAAIFAAITVTATYDDDSTQTLTSGLTLEGFDATVLDTPQSVVVKYGDLSSTAFEVLVESTPVIVVVTDIEVTFDGDKVEMQKDGASEQALRALLTVSAIKSDASSETITDYEVLGLDLTKFNEDQTVTIKYGKFTKTVTVRIVDDSTDPDPDNPDPDPDTPDPDEYEVYLYVEGHEEDKITLTLNDANESQDYVEYKGVITLAIGDVVVIIDSEGNTYEVYEGDFNGTATKAGEHTFYAMKWENGQRKIRVDEPATVVDPDPDPDPDPDVPVPEEGVFIIIDDGEPIAITTENPDKNGEFILLGYALTEGAEVVIYRDGVILPYKAEYGCKFDGTVYLTGEYDFYVDDAGVWVAYWLQITVERDGNVITTLIPELAPDSDSYDTEKYSAQYKAIIPMRQGDKVTIKDISGATFSYEAGSAIPANGVATQSGDYTFYVKVSKTENGGDVWVSRAELSVKSITTNVEGTLVLYGVQANDLKAHLVVTALYSDGSTQTVTTYTTSPFNKSLLDVEQEVTISFGGVTTKVTVKVMAAYVTGITATYDGDEIELIGVNATVENLLAAITVTATYNDGTTQDVTQHCSVESFNPELFTVQDVEIHYGEFKTTVIVKVTAATADHLVIEPHTVTAIGADENEVIDVIKSKIIVTVVMTDGTSHTSTSYTVALDADFAFDNFDTKQGATVTCEGKDLAIEVQMIKQPKSISANVSEIKILEMQAGAATREAAVRAKLTVTLLSTDGSEKTIDDYLVEFGDFQADKFDGAQEITISYGSLDKLTIQVTVVAVPKIAINDGSATYMAVSAENTYVRADVELKVGDRVSITLAGQTVAFTGSNFNGVAELSGNYAFTVTVDEHGAATVTCEIPAYTVTLTVKGTDKKVTLELNANPTDKTLKAEYVTKALALKVNDEIVITDNKGNTIDTYQICGFDGTALDDGNFDVYVREHADGTTDIFVKIPYYTLSVLNGDGTLKQIYLLELDAAQQYVIKGLSLGVGEKVIVSTPTNANRTDWQADCRFKGTVYLAGDYDFYVKTPSNIWVSYWIEISIERGGSVIDTVVPGLAPAEDGYDTNKFSAQYKAEISLRASDKITIKDTGGNTFTYEAGCAANMPSTGIAPKNGDYTFYIKVGKAVKDDAVWVAYTAPTVVSISINVEETIVLYGIEANDLLAYLKKNYTVTALYSDGETKVVTVYTISGFDKTKLNQDQTVTVSYDGKSTQITVQVLPAYVTAISAEYDGERIELIGVKATVQNVLAAITVTATYNDGTTQTVQCTVNTATFNATLYGQLQNVEICYGDVTTTVPVMVIAATADHLVIEPQTVTAMGASESEVIDVIKSKITVTVVMTDGTSHMSTLYEVALDADFDFANFDEKQGATVTCEGKDLAIEVQMIKEPKEISVDKEEISILESEVATMTAEAAIKAYIEVTLTSTDNSTKIINDYEIDLGDFRAENFGVAQTVTISYGSLEKITIQVTVVAVPKIAINGGAATYMYLGGGSYASEEIELEVGDTVVITLAGEQVSFADSGFSGTAELSGTYTFNVTVIDGEATVTCTVPEYVVTLAVKGGITTTLTRNTSPSSSLKSEYYVTGLSLKANDEITITDNKGRTLDTYQNCGFNGKALAAGTFEVRVQEATNGTVTITVKIPYYALSVLTSSNAVREIYLLTLDSAKGEYVGEGIMMEKNDKAVVFTSSGTSRTDWDSGCGFNGTAANKGYHDFYVKTSGKIWVTTAYRNVYYQKTVQTSWYDVYVYSWLNSNNSDSNGWPGVQMSWLGEVGGYHWYKGKISVKYDRVIFDNGNGGGTNQTGDLVITAGYTDLYMNFNGVTSNRPTGLI